MSLGRMMDKIEIKPLLGDNDDIDDQSPADLLKEQSRSLRIPFRIIAQVSLPLGGFIFVIVWALYTDFKGSTSTHCKVQNWLPSISAAMGSFEISLYIWRICIALQGLPRFMIAAMYYRYLSSVLFKRYLFWAKVACLLNILENIGLIGLTFASSRENYYIHEKSFGMFMICSETYMVLMCLLLWKGRNIPPTSMESKSIQAKRNFVIINWTAGGLAFYTFLRHNNFCEKGMYTFFAIFEYIVVLTNMGFHMTAYWDFYTRVLSIGRSGFKMY